MGRRHDVALTRGWVRLGTDRLVGAVDALPDDAFTAPGLLPGWSRAHVVAHVARNAEALARLATWARTGVETPMYADPASRDADIERTARATPDELRADLRVTAQALDEAFDALDEAAYGATVRAAQGREMRASVLPWLRVREVWLHAEDLDAGAGPAAGPDPAPAALVDELLADVTTTVSGAEDCPPVVLAPDDRDDVVALGGHEGDQAAGPVTVRGPALALLLWVAGRGGGADLVVDGDAALPVLPRWL